MNSNEIIKQYLADSLTRTMAIEQLNALSTKSATLLERQEATKARYATSFLVRFRQYKVNEASAHDLCLNLRNLILFIGRLRVSKQLYDLISQKGRGYGLVCESGMIVSCISQDPDWLVQTVFVQDVYQLNPGENWQPEEPSVGDMILSQKTRFNAYKSFEQKLAVHTALNLPNGFTLLVSQQTGGGKSLVTQMLSVVTDSLTVVIVPTVALALDQYYAAQSNLRMTEGIFCYRGDQSQEERINIIRALRDKTARLLFTSPEAVFKNSELFQLLESAASDKYLRNIVVDEAHIVPDWGVFFRPDFQIFSVVLRKWRKASGYHIRTYLLSATLSDDVVDTLFTLFGEASKNVQLRCDALRQEPRFYIYKVKTKSEQDQKTIEAIKLLPKPMVVYVLEPHEAEDLNKKLKDLGYLNIPTFTGKTKDAERDSILKGWKHGLYDVVIATSAFGIGVDKPDVRTIIHACVPENLSRFYQEVGRGGRDGLPSLSLMLPYTSYQEGEGDLSRARGLVSSRVLRVESVVNRWRGMRECSGSDINGNIAVLDTTATPPTMSEEEVEYAGARNVAWNINLLLLLNRIGFISLEDAFFSQENNSYYMTAKLLVPDILGDDEKLFTALEIPRQEELELQLRGYNIMSAIVQHPTASCWGKVFKNLFPLSKESCNGCPIHPNGRVLLDSRYKLRTSPNITIPATPVQGRLKRLMSFYNTLIISRVAGSAFEIEEIRHVIECATNGGIRTLVIPDELANYFEFHGLILTYDEFVFAVSHTPYLMADGVLSVFGFRTDQNEGLLYKLYSLDLMGYKQILYCNDQMRYPITGKPIRESIDCYSISAEDL